MLTAFASRSVRLTCARSCCSRSASSRCSGWVGRPDARRRLHGHPALHRRGRGQLDLRADQPVQRRRAAAALGLRARDHAVHHGEHHPAAARRGHPAAGGPQEGGPGRPGQDHPVHPLPDHRARRAAVHRRSSRWRACRGGCSRGAASSCSRTSRSRLIVTMVLTMTAGTALIMWLGELITDRGVGNGMSLLIFTSIIATFPGPLATICTVHGVVHPGRRPGGRRR